MCPLVTIHMMMCPLVTVHMMMMVCIHNNTNSCTHRSLTYQLGRGFTEPEAAYLQWVRP